MVAKDSRSLDTEERLEVQGVRLGRPHPRGLYELAVQPSIEDELKWKRFDGGEGVEITTCEGAVVSIGSERRFVVNGVNLIGLAVEELAETLGVLGSVAMEARDPETGLEVASYDFDDDYSVFFTDGRASHVLRLEPK